MSERPEADKPPLKTEEKPPEPPKPPEHLTTAEKPGTGKPPTDPPKPKGTWYGNDKYPDGFTMHHDQGGSISLTHPTEGSATWDGDTQKWVDMAGHPMPEGWGGGHKPEFQEFQSGPSDKSPM